MQVPELTISPSGEEATQHGSPAFPLAVYHSVMARNVLGFTPWHWHTEIQFCLITKGSIRFFVNERQHLLQTGEGIFVGSGYLHMARPETEPDSAYICLDADSKLLCAFPGSAVETNCVFPFLQDPSMAHCPLSPAIPWQGEILRRIKEAYEAFEERLLGYELRLAALVMEMWLLLLEHREEGGTPPRSARRENAIAQEILTYLSQNLHRSITLQEVANAVSFSPSECCRIFKRVTGETIFSGLKACRLNRSLELLRTTDLPVSQIACETGFCSASYFIEAFKARHGITPLQYRRRFALL